jgi:Big-like domain-containing protein
MSMFLDDLDSLDEWSNDEGEEEYFGDESENLPEAWYDEEDEESRKKKARRRQAMASRQRRLSAAKRQRMSRGRAKPQPRTAKAAIQSTRQDLKQVALESQVRDDQVGTALARLDKRTVNLARSNAAATLVPLIQNRLNDFAPGLDAPTQQTVKEGIAYLPGIFADSGKKGLADPRLQALIGGGLVIGLAALLRRSREDDDSSGVLTINQFVTELPVTGKSTFRANRAGVIWSSDNTTVASVDPATGLVTALDYGVANITATLGQEFDVRALTVTGDKGGSHVATTKSSTK